MSGIDLLTNCEKKIRTTTLRKENPAWGDPGIISLGAGFWFPKIWHSSANRRRLPHSEAGLGRFPAPMRRRLGLCLNDGKAFAAGVAHVGRYEASATNRRRPHPNPLIPKSEGFGGCSPAAWGFRTTAVPRFRTPLVQRRWSPRAFACRVEKRQDYCRRAWVAYLLLGGLFLPVRTGCRN